MGKKNNIIKHHKDFSPAEITDLQLFGEFDNKETLNTKMAFDSVSSAGNYLQSDSAAPFNKSGYDDYTFGGWVHIHSNGTSWGSGVLGNYTNSGYGIYQNGSVLTIRVGDNTTGTAFTFGSTYYDAWHHFVVSVDGTNATIRIYIDGALVSTKAMGGPTITSADGFKIASIDVIGERQVAMYADSCFFSNRVMDLNDAIEMYGGGNGIAYTDLSNVLKVDLESWWSLDELSGIRYDAHGINNLSEIGSPSYTLGIVKEPILNNSNIKIWSFYDQSPNGIQYNQNILSSQSGYNNPDGELIFDGVDDYIELDELLPIISGDSVGSMGIWCKPNDNTQQWIINFGDYSLNSYLGCYIGSNKYGFAVVINTVITTNLLTTTVAIMGEWVHLCVVEDGINLKYYINGILVNTITGGNWLSDGEFDKGTIGALTRSGGISNHFNGSLAEPIYYSKALTQDEVTTIYNNKSNIYN